VGRDREVGRYLFQTHSSEIEWNRCEILYEVNTETRKLIKRSSRERELKKSLKLKRCRRYRLWKLRGRINRCGRVTGGDERHFCSQVAQTNKLELLKWAREEKKCASGIQGRLERPQNKVIWKW